MNVRWSITPCLTLAALCLGLGLFPGVVLRALEGVVVSLPGLRAAKPMATQALGMAPGIGMVDRVVPGPFAVVVICALIVAGLVTAFRKTAVRRAPISKLCANDAGWSQRRQSSSAGTCFA